MGHWRLECGANDLHMVQLMPMPPVISGFSKIQNGLPFWCRLTQAVLEKRPLNVCVLKKQLQTVLNFSGNTRKLSSLTFLTAGTQFPLI